MCTCTHQSDNALKTFKSESACCNEAFLLGFADRAHTHQYCGRARTPRPELLAGGQSLCVAAAVQPLQQAQWPRVGPRRWCWLSSVDAVLPAEIPLRPAVDSTLHLVRPRGLVPAIWIALLKHFDEALPLA
jgi:hypothetical protein